MTLMWFWFVTSGAYVLIGIFNCLMARRLRRTNLPSPARNWIKYPEEERRRVEEQHFQTLSEKEKLHNKGEISPEAYQIEVVKFTAGFNELRVMRSEENLNTAFDKLDTFANEFNSATTLNRCVLYVAAASFFLAAGISFVQGVIG